MAAASSTANLFSFFTQSRPPKSPPSKFSISCTLSQAPHSASSSEATSVVYPSLAYSNTLFFRSGYNVQVIVDDNEPEEKLLGRFRREVMRAGVINECKRRRFFENKQEEKKRKSREAAKRNRRRRPQSRFTPQDRPESSANKNRDEDEDNWDLPEGDLPY